jgi:hypothetical protein
MLTIFNREGMFLRGYWPRTTITDNFCRSGKTINAEYTIDPALNGGLEFRYDEVVRTKEDLRHMDAGGCECCRDVSTNYLMNQCAAIRLSTINSSTPARLRAMAIPAHQSRQVKGIMFPTWR